jgi:hypothetical protein
MNHGQVVKYSKRLKLPRRAGKKMMKVKYNWVVGMRKAAYVAMMMLSVAITAMVKTGQFEGPEDLTWPLIVTGLTVAADWLRNYVKVAKPDASGINNKIPIVLLMITLAAMCGGCAISTTRFEERANVGTPDEMITKYNGVSWTPPLGKRESANLIWNYELADGVSKISTGQQDIGIDNTGQAELVKMLGSVVLKAVEGYFAGQVAAGITPIDVIHDALPLVGGRLKLGE